MLKNHQLGSLPAIAVVIPCFNEALAITAVLDEFKAAVPQKFDTISAKFRFLRPGLPMNSSTYDDFQAEGKKCL